MVGLEVIDDPAAATVALDPVRSRLLAELAEPASAATLAGRVGLARQKVNYHLRVAADPGRENDRLSATYLIALAARVIRDMGKFLRLAQKTGKRLATLSIDTEVRFRSAADRAAFTQELTDTVTKLVSRYHDATVAGGRAHRLVALAYPKPLESKAEEPS